MKKLKPNVYTILQECIEIGINSGFNKAHKHTDNPTEEHLKEEVLRYIMLQISEKFIFDD